MRGKKAVVEVQLNWVFILIAGALILAFFIGIALKQKTSSETTVNVKVVNDLNSVLTGAGVSAGTTSKIDIPKTDMNIGCDEISIGSVRRSLRNTILFSPDNIQGNKLIIWTLEWNFPFKITNFLFMTSPQVRYIFIYDPAVAGSEPWARELLNEMPNSTTKEAVAKGTVINDRNNYKIRAVFAGMTPDRAMFSSIKGDVAILELQEDKLKFDQADEVDYLGEKTDPVVFAAIFSENYELYACNMQRAFKRFSLVAEIMESKTLALSEHFERRGCGVFYNPASLGSMKNKTKTCSEDLKQCIVSSFKEDIRTIKSRNTALQKDSCPLIY